MHPNFIEKNDSGEASKSSNILEIDDHSRTSSSKDIAVGTFDASIASRIRDVTHASKYSKNAQLDATPRVKAVKRGNKSQNEHSHSSNRLKFQTRSRAGRKTSHDIAKLFVRSRKKRRREDSSLVNYEEPQHRKTKLQRPLSEVYDDGNSTEKEFTKQRRSLELSNAHPVLRHHGERVLFRYKRDGVLVRRGKERSQKHNRRKRKKKREASLKHIKERSVPATYFRLNTGHPLSTGHPAKSVLEQNSKSLIQTGNPFSKASYGQLIRRGSISSPNPFIASPMNEYEQRKSILNNIARPLSSPNPASANILQNINQFGRKQEIQLPQFPLKRQKLPSESTSPTGLYNTAGSLRTRIQLLTNFQNRLGRVQPSSNAGFVRKQFIPASQSAFYNYRPQLHYAPQSVNLHLPIAHVSSPVVRYPQPVQVLPPTSPQLAKSWNPIFPQVDRMISNGDASTQRSAGPQGLVMSLNFEDVANGKSPYAYFNGDLAGAEKRTEISSYFGSCGKIARINNGSEILLDGANMKVKKNSLLQKPISFTASA